MSVNQFLDVDGKFKAMKSEEVAKLEEGEMFAYKDAEIADSVSKLKELTEKGDASAEVIESLKEDIATLKDVSYADLRGTVKKQGEVIAELKKKGIPQGSPKFKDAMKTAWDEGISGLQEAVKSRGVHEITISKASQTYGDIDSGLDFAAFRPGVVDIPVRIPKIRQLFGTIPVSTEFLKYTEQNTVVRDADNVAKCTAVTSNTKETLIVRSIETKVIKDMLDFCRSFVDDYPFMQSRINRLLGQSLSLRVDQQLLLGSGLLEETFSIDSVSSEFAANNAACDISLSIQAPTMVDLIMGMETQIVELGQQNDFEPNIVLVNKCDWFTQVESRKDLNNNYLDGRVTMVGKTPFINGMQIIWTPLVVQNTLYVLDSSKGEIVDRKQVVIEVAFENRDNWEKEIATLKGYERLNFLVPNNWANAFMKCSDVAAAIIAITKV